MKRRSFLGFLGAGAAAAPIVANNAIKSIPNGLGDGLHLSPPMPCSPTSNAGITANTGFDWRASEIARLQTLLAGGMSEEERKRSELERLNHLHRLSEQNIAALHSVSASAKVRMHLERNEQISKQTSRKWAEFDLWRYMTGKM